MVKTFLCSEEQSKLLNVAPAWHPYQALLNIIFHHPMNACLLMLFFVYLLPKYKNYFLSHTCVFSNYSTIQEKLSRLALAPSREMNSEIPM